MTLRVRFAPSPTGYLHIGGARTALFNWLIARHSGGTFVLRIEDTDRERSTEAAVQAILDGMKWLGMDWDEGPIFQTHRMERYQEVITELKAKGHAYECTCTSEELDAMRALAMAEKRKPKYDGRCRLGRSHADRPACTRLLSRDEGSTGWEDQIKGPIRFENSELDDLVIARADGTPTYNFCVVVDDYDMAITHVIRGDDHVNNTPRQIQLYEALGWPTPVFAHVPMILGGDKQRLSKRHGATSVLEYKEQGYLSWALVNYLARLSWSHGDQEIFSKEELVAAFTVEAVGRSPGSFDLNKLASVNSHYLKLMTKEAVATELAPFVAKELGRDVSADPRLPRIAALYQERAKTFVEMAKMSAFFFRADDEIAYDEKSRAKALTPESKPLLQAIRERFAAANAFTAAELEPLLTGLAAERDVKLAAIAQPVRVALCGSTASPGLFDVLELLGKNATLARLQRAIDSLA